MKIVAPLILTLGLSFLLYSTTTENLAPPRSHRQGNEALAVEAQNIQCPGIQSRHSTSTEVERLSGHPFNRSSTARAGKDIRL